MGTWNSRRRIISFVTHDEQKSLRCMRSYGCVRVSHPLRPCDRVGHAATFPSFRRLVLSQWNWGLFCCLDAQNGLTFTGPSPPAFFAA